MEMLNALGVQFSSCATAVDESVYDDRGIGDRVVALARLKAQTGLGTWMGGSNPAGPMLVIGADTLVSVDGFALGKASDKDEAGRMLRMLSGRMHTVSTGLCVIESSTRRMETALSETKVSFVPLSEAEIDWYLATGEWVGAAGAYRIQEHASYFVERVEGSFSGVVGLPLHAFYAILCRFGYRFPSGRQAGTAR
jgi:septum formation protein